MNNVFLDCEEAQKLIGDINSDLKLLFIRQLCYSSNFLEFFFKITFRFTEYLIKESFNTKIIQYKDIWNFHRDIWFVDEIAGIWLTTKDDVDEQLTTQKQHKIQHNDIPMHQYPNPSNKNLLGMDSLETFIKALPSRVFNISIHDDPSSILETTPTLGISLNFQWNTTAMIINNNLNTMMVDLQKFNTKLLNLLFGIIKQEEETHTKKSNENKLKITLFFHMLSYENFLLIFHVWLLLLMYTQTREDIIMFQKNLSQFVLKSPLFKIFGDEKRKLCLINIVNRLNIVNNSQKVINISQIKTNTLHDIYWSHSCTPTCYCCTHFIKRLIF